LKPLNQFGTEKAPPPARTMRRQTFMLHPGKERLRGDTEKPRSARRVEHELVHFDEVTPERVNAIHDHAHFVAHNGAYQLDAGFNPRRPIGRRGISDAEASPNALRPSLIEADDSGAWRRFAIDGVVTRVATFSRIQLAHAPPCLLGCAHGRTPDDNAVSPEHGRQAPDSARRASTWTLRGSRTTFLIANRW
jgi:hypothetical protein